MEGGRKGMDRRFLCVNKGEEQRMESGEGGGGGVWGKGGGGGGEEGKKRGGSRSGSMEGRVGGIRACPHLVNELEVSALPVPQHSLSASQPVLPRGYAAVLSRVPWLQARETRGKKDEGSCKWDAPLKHTLLSSTYSTQRVEIEAHGLATPCPLRLRGFTTTSSWGKFYTPLTSRTPSCIRGSSRERCFRAPLLATK